MKKHKYIGVLSWTYDSGIGIVSVDSDYVRSQVFGGSSCGRLQRALIHYNQAGEPYFCSAGRRYYLKEFIRT